MALPLLPNYTYGRAIGNYLKCPVDAALDYLVLGGLGTSCWYLGERGLEYELAVLYRHLGLKIRIVHEAQWHEAIRAMQSKR